MGKLLARMRKGPKLNLPGRRPASRPHAPIPARRVLVVPPSVEEGHVSPLQSYPQQWVDAA